MSNFEGQAGASGDQVGRRVGDEPGSKKAVRRILVGDRRGALAVVLVVGANKGRRGWRSGEVVLGAEGDASTGVTSKRVALGQSARRRCWSSAVLVNWRRCSRQPAPPRRRGELPLRLQVEALADRVASVGGELDAAERHVEGLLDVAPAGCSRRWPRPAACGRRSGPWCRPRSSTPSRSCTRSGTASGRRPGSAAAASHRQCDSPSKPSRRRSRPGSPGS